MILVTIMEDQNLGYALGASEYLTKPVDRERLSAVLQRFLDPADEARVLVVEDDEPTRELLVRALSRDGWAVDEARNGREALECVARSTPALILLDLLMPVMDGFEFLHALHERAEWRALPVVVTTAKELDARERAFLAEETERIIQKGGPSEEDFLGEVRRLVRAHGVAAVPAGDART